MQYYLLQWVVGLTSFFLIMDFGSPSSRSSDCGKQRLADIRSYSPWPWMVAITIIDKKFSDYHLKCTGVLIDHTHVMTSAHCVKDKKLIHYQARIGHVDWTRGDKYWIIRMVTHESYTDGRYENDIAMLTLDRPVTKPGFNPVCLPTEEDRILNLDNEKATIVGWRRKDSGENATFLYEQKRISVVSNEQCDRVYQEKSSRRNYLPNGINNKIICAGFQEGEKQGCAGAGSGPLMMQRKNRWYVVGIHSFRFPCKTLRTPSGFTRVSEYLEWIWKHVFMY